MASRQTAWYVFTYLTFLYFGDENEANERFRESVVPMESLLPSLSSALLFARQLASFLAVQSFAIKEEKVR